MKRQWVVGILILAVAGCAQSRSAISKRDGKPPDPVAVTPVPSVYDTINRGLGGPAIARTAMKNPNDPAWTGRDQVTTVARPAANGPINPGQGPSQPPSSVAASGPGPLGPMGVQAPQPLAPALHATAAPAAAMAPATLEASGSPAPSGLMPAPATTAPEALAAASGPISRPTAMSNPVPLTGPAPSPIQGPRAAPPGLTANGASSAKANKPPINGLRQSSPTADVAVTPSASPQPLTPAPPGATKASIRRSDPLLGPNPDLMPEMPPLPDEKPAAAPSAAATEVPFELAPASSAPAQPSPGAAADLEPSGPMSAVNPSAVANKPALAGKLAAAVPRAAVAALEPSVVSSGGTPAPEAAALRIPKRRDDRVTKAAASASSPEDALERHLGTEAGRSVARVGDEVITSHDLVVASREQLTRQPDLQSRISFDSSQELEKHKHVQMVVKYTLDALVERSLLVQEAKHAIKDPKQLDKMMDIADKVWREEQIPQLKVRYSVETDQELKEKMAESGRSLEHMRKAFRQDFLAQGFLQERLKDKLKIELPDLLKYYNDHMNDPEFQRPAQITWRELVVEIDKYPSRQDAEKKASALLARLRRGEDFAKLARTESDGPSSSRKEGGLMQTSPGSYAVATVNQALDSLPIRKVSGILEGPTSLHIVRVEGRRPAGPASFEEVHQQIRPMLFEEKVRTERAAFITKLRQRTLISTMFDAPVGQRNEFLN